jgi:hypothetical protein
MPATTRTPGDEHDQDRGRAWIILASIFVASGQTSDRHLRQPMMFCFINTTAAVKPQQPHRPQVPAITRHGRSDLPEPAVLAGLSTGLASECCVSLRFYSRAHRGMVAFA